MTRGSPITRPTVIRESSEAIGSWKMNCIRGRTLSSVLVSASSTCTGPSSGWRKMTSPPVGSSSRMMVRPVVDLPQPDSPTMATVSPRSTLERDAVDGLDLADHPAQRPALDGEVLLQAAHLQQRAFGRLAGSSDVRASCLARFGACRPAASSRSSPRLRRRAGQGSSSS